MKIVFLNHSSVFKFLSLQINITNPVQALILTLTSDLCREFNLLLYEKVQRPEVSQQQQNKEGGGQSLSLDMQTVYYCMWQDN